MVGLIGSGLVRSGSIRPGLVVRPDSLRADRLRPGQVRSVTRHVVAQLGPDVGLARPGDLLVLVAEQLLPVGQPARRAGDGEQHREHLDREAHRLVDEARVEVDVRVELAATEVVVAQRHLFELEGDVEQRVLAGDLEHLVGGLLDDRGPRVVVLVDAVAEAHQPALARLHVLDERRHVVDRADLGEHAHDLLVGAAVQRAVERRGGGRGRASTGRRATSRRPAWPWCRSSARGRRGG